MTILFFSRLFYPHIGGVETHVLEVGDRLAKKGHKIILVTEELSGDRHKNWQSDDESARQTGGIESKISSWEIYRIPLGKANVSESSKKWKIWWWLWHHRDLIQKADVVHCHDVFFWFLPFRFLCRDKPVFTTFHGYETVFPPAKRAITIRQWSEKLSWGNICVGDFIKKWYGTHPDFVTYGGVDIQAIKDHQNDKVASEPIVSESFTDKQKVKEADNTKKIRNEVVRILFVGRLSADTGILAYDQAISILNKKSKQSQFELMVLGDGLLKDNLENLLRSTSYEQNIYPYIKSAHIIFASSYLSILQALAMKKPVIAFYDNPLKEDYLKMSPFARWIFVENSSEKIAQRVLDILAEKEPLAEKLKEAYLWVSGQTWENVTTLYIKLWNRKMHLK